MYTDRNFKTKKELKDAVANKERVGIHAPGFGTAPINGEVSVEGPWYPQPHRWYARVVIEAGWIIKVK